MRSDRRGFLAMLGGAFAAALAAMKATHYVVHGTMRATVNDGYYGVAPDLGPHEFMPVAPAPGYVIVEAGETLRMGEMVRFKDGKAYRWKGGDRREMPVGHVIDADQEFPNVVISLDTHDYPFHPVGGYAVQVGPDGPRDSWRNVWP